MFSKPCARPGCAELVTAPMACRLRHKQYHSQRCAYEAKRERGWVPHRYLTPEARRRGALKGAKVLGARRHREAMERAVTACMDLMPAEFQRDLPARTVALIKALVGRAYLRGWSNGVRKDDLARRRARQAAEQKASAA
jgi:hypothetical protein